jgi:putative RecB family exonuclease
MTILLGPDWVVPRRTLESRIRKYSTTGDILSFRRCRRQYGYFGVRGFAGADATQRYFGTLVHDVLDQLNRQHRSGSAVPTDNSAITSLVRECVEKAHERLVRTGVRTYKSHDQRERAATLITRFVQLLGSTFFANVTETEYRLERPLRTSTDRPYILEGVVDVLSGAASHALRLPFGTAPDDVEIWDYKSGRRPAEDSDELQTYVYQMLVYAELYYQQTGRYPARSVLVFLGELGNDTRWNEVAGDPARFKELFYAVDPIGGKIDVTTAIEDFGRTVDEIEAERSRPYQLQWEVPIHEVDPQTCDACDIRFSCLRFASALKQRKEPL